MNITYMSAPNVISTKILTVSSCAAEHCVRGRLYQNITDTWNMDTGIQGGVAIISVHL